MTPLTSRRSICGSKGKAAAACLCALVLAASSAEGKWAADPAAGCLRENGVVISYRPDSAHAQGIVLAKVKEHPAGVWTLDSLPRIEADTGLRPTAIGSSFITWNRDLRSFAIPGSVREIGPCAFQICGGATNALVLPEGLEKIGWGAFEGCAKLGGTLVIPAGVEMIDVGTFNGCAGLTGLVFAPGSRLKSIYRASPQSPDGGGAFENCGGIRGTVDFRPCADLESIEPEAFCGCHPDRVVFGEAFKRRVAERLKAADATNGYPRASTDWFAHSVGIGVHWTTWTTDRDGNKGSFDKAVDAFDVPRFVAQVKKSGARHVIFTSSWAEQHPPAPCAALDRILPGRTTKRNLLKDISEGLAKEGIRTILYYNHGCNQEDPEWMKACGYSSGHLEQFGSNIVAIVRELSLGCGRAVSGWWFDSTLALSTKRRIHFKNGVDLSGYDFPFRELSLAAKAGNPDSIISLNSQGGTFVYSPCQEYYSGEEQWDFPLCGRTNAQGMQMHIWCTMDNGNWVHMGRGFSNLRFKDAELAKFIRERTADGCAVTFNVDVDRSGLLNPAAIDQLARVTK